MNPPAATAAGLLDRALHRRHATAIQGWPGAWMVAMPARNPAGAATVPAYLRSAMTIPEQDAIASEILRQTAARGPDRSICPSEVARALAGGDAGPWRPLLGRVRQAAIALAEAGRVEILRKGKPVPPAEVRGVIRLRRPAPPAAGEPGA